MTIEKLNAINAISFFIAIIFENMMRGKKKEESDDEFKIRDRKEACISLGILLMMIAVFFIASKSLSFFILTTLGLLAYCFTIFFKTIYHSLKKNASDMEANPTKVLIAQFAGIYLSVFLQEFSAFADESHKEILMEFIMICEMFICYSINMFFILNDLHIVIVDLKECIKNINEKKQKQKKKETKTSAINFLRFEEIVKNYEESYEKIDKYKNKFVRNVIYKLQFIMYVLLFAVGSLIFFFITYPLAKIKELLCLCAKFLYTKFMEIFNSYKLQDMYRYSRISMIISMIWVFVIINNNSEVSIEIKNILEILTTVILIPVILESMQNIKES